MTDQIWSVFIMGVRKQNNLPQNRISGHFVFEGRGVIIPSIVKEHNI